MTVNSAWIYFKTKKKKLMYFLILVERIEKNEQFMYLHICIKSFYIDAL